MISVVIPSYKDPLLHKTIDSLLDNSVGEIEIIPVLDGYKTEVKDDPRVKPIFLEKNVGMRDAINIGVSKAKGKYIMRTDEHCMFGKCFDMILTDNIEDNWIVTPRRYLLNPDKWERFGDPIDHEKMVIRRSVIGKRKGGMKFHSAQCGGPDDIVSEKTAMQGSCWIMTIGWWHNVIGKLQTEGYGTHYQDSVEMIFKTWQAGGKLMLNKGTWYAHKAKEFPRTHSYPTKLAEKSWAYALSQWEDYFKGRK